MSDDSIATAEQKIRDNQAGLYQSTLTETSAKQEGLKNHAASENARRASADDSGEFVGNVAENALAPGLQMAGLAVQAIGALNSDPAGKGAKTMESDKAAMFSPSKGNAIKTNSIKTSHSFPATDKMMNGKLAQVAGTGKMASKSANTIFAKKSEGLATDAKAAEGVSKSAAEAKLGMTRSYEHHQALGNAHKVKQELLAENKAEVQAAPVQVAGYAAPSLGMGSGPKGPSNLGKSSSDTDTSSSTGIV